MKTFTLALCYLLLHCTLNLSSQDKVLTYNTEKKNIAYDITRCGKDRFFVTYGKALLSKKASKYLMEFDSELNPLWDKPIEFSGTTGVEFLSYTNPLNNKTVSYILGSKQFMQIGYDGEVVEKQTELVNKETKNIAASFVDSIGLNFIIYTSNQKKLLALLIGTLFRMKA